MDKIEAALKILTIINASVETGAQVAELVSNSGQTYDVETGLKIARSNFENIRDRIEARRNEKENEE